MIDRTAAEALERELRIGHCQSAGAPVRCWCGRPWPCAVIRAADFLRDALAEVKALTERAEKAEAKNARWQAEMDVATQDVLRNFMARKDAEKERDDLRTKLDAQCAECLRVAEAIGSVEFMDPPDGGNVTLSEQVRRMRAKLDALAVPPHVASLVSELSLASAYIDQEKIDSAQRAIWNVRTRLAAIASPPSAPVLKERAELVAELRAISDELVASYRLAATAARVSLVADALASPQAAAEPGGQSELVKRLRDLERAAFATGTGGGATFENAEWASYNAAVMNALPNLLAALEAQEGT